MVVSEDRPILACLSSKVAPGGAEILPGGGCGVIHVEGVGDTITVPVRGIRGPRRGDELHRPHSVVVHGITIEYAVIGVNDQPGADTVQGNADDPRGGQAVGQEHGAGIAAMIGLNASDRC